MDLEFTAAEERFRSEVREFHAMRRHGGIGLARELPGDGDYRPMRRIAPGREA